MVCVGWGGEGFGWDSVGEGVGLLGVAGGVGEVVCWVVGVVAAGAGHGA